MFNLGWVQLCWPSTPIAVGATVGVLVHVLRLWSLNACRVVYTLDEEGEVKLFGFAYGTLPDHAERGEERFSIQWERRNDSVWYDLTSVQSIRMMKQLRRAGRRLHFVYKAGRAAFISTAI